MPIRILVTIVTIMITFTSADARPFTRGCPSHADQNFRDVVNYLRSNMGAVRSNFESNNSYHPRRGANRRVKRRLERGRKLRRLWFACARKSAPLCKNASGRHAFGAASRKIRICYFKFRPEAGGGSFCNLVRIVAHEFGHAVGIKKDRVGLHSRRQNDRVYRWGWEWRDYCEADPASMDRSLI